MLFLVPDTAIGRKAQVIAGSQAVSYDEERAAVIFSQDVGCFLGSLDLLEWVEPDPAGASFIPGEEMPTVGHREEGSVLRGDGR